MLLFLFIYPHPPPTYLSAKLELLIL